jgi:hypothetical protein
MSHYHDIIDADREAQRKTANAIQPADKSRDQRIADLEAENAALRAGFNADGESSQEACCEDIKAMLTARIADLEAALANERKDAKAIASVLAVRTNERDAAEEALLATREELDRNVHAANEFAVTLKGPLVIDGVMSYEGVLAARLAAERKAGAVAALYMASNVFHSGNAEWCVEMAGKVECGEVTL